MYRTKIVAYQLPNTIIVYLLGHNPFKNIIKSLDIRKEFIIYYT